jgi:hypothetical protein
VSIGWQPDLREEQNDPVAHVTFFSIPLPVFGPNSEALLEMDADSRQRSL